MTHDQNEYLKELGIDLEVRPKEDTEKLREAYERAHDIRKFEIEMYWRRSAYLWTLQAAALAGLALVVAQAEFQPWECQDPQLPEEPNCVAERIRILVVVSIWLFGTFSAYVWLLLLRGAKHWQNNWERHVDALEDFFSGALYKTYPDGKTEAPYSVTKLNELMARFMLILWLFLGIGSMFIYFDDLAHFGIATGLVGLSLLLAWLLGDLLRMKDYPRAEPLTSAERGSDFEKLRVLSRPRPKFSSRDKE